MAQNSFESWIDFLVTDPSLDEAEASRPVDVAGDASGVRPDAELVYVRVARREVPLALQLPLEEPSETDGLRLYRRKRRKDPDWLVRGTDDPTRY